MEGIKGIEHRAWSMQGVEHRYRVPWEKVHVVFKWFKLN